MAFRNFVAASTFRVFVDGVEVGHLNQDEQLKVRVEPGLRKVKIKSPLAASNEVSHEFANGDRLTLNCRTKLTGIVLIK